MTEKHIEQALVKAVKQHGGLCIKLTSPSMNGLPDRLCLFSGGKAGFVEVKASGKTPRALQKVRHKQLMHLGFSVFVLDDRNEIDEVIHAISGA